jgi:cytochrome c oxidase cbb3-type subunit 4
MQLDPTYAAVAHFAQTWGLGYFVAVFLIVLVYALWPSRRREFEQAAQIPLRED